jgi:hypothetical protein
MHGVAVMDCIDLDVGTSRGGCADIYDLDADGDVDIIDVALRQRGSVGGCLRYHWWRE